MRNQRALAAGPEQKGSMANIGFRSPVKVQLLRFGASKPLPPNPRAHDTFRVTTRFLDPDTLGRRDAAGNVLRHNAIDIGNFRCGDPVIAMAGGVARRTHDDAKAHGAANDALGIVIDHGDGVVTEYWHLSSFAVADRVKVRRGQQIGFVGNTGLGGACHCHVELKLNGVQTDPEPHMFGQALSITASNTQQPGGQTMALRFGGAQYRPIINRQFTTLPVVRFRAEPSTKSAILKEFQRPVVVVPSGVVKAERVANVTAAPGFKSNEWFEARMHTGRAFELGYFHASTLTGERRSETG
jgi:hypothetical protein